MRILVLTNMYPPHSYGGYELECQDVVTRWRQRGHEVLVLTSDVQVPGVGDAEGQEDGPRDVRRELRLYWHDHLILHPPLHRRLGWERANQSALARALIDFNPEVASVWAMGAMSFGLLYRLADLRLPTVQVICDEWPVYGPEVDAWGRLFRRRPLLARMVGAATRLPTGLPDLDVLGPACFVSEFLRHCVRDRSPWSFPDSTVVYSGIQRREFPFSESTGRAWRWRLLYVGRIDSRKGIDIVIRALPQCPPEATLMVCGRGDEVHLRELRRLGDELGVGDRVQFTTSTRDELARRYSSADVVVFPSVWEEPFGLVPLEAMSCGTPVVGTAVGGAAEFLVDEENCLTFTPAEASTLALSLHRLAEDDSLRARLVAGGRATAEEFDVDRLAETLESWHRYAARPSDTARPSDRRRAAATGLGDA